MKSSKGFVLITGGSMGIGASCAKLLADSGYNLLLNGRNKKRLEKMAEALSTECLIVEGDVSDPAIDQEILDLLGEHPLRGLIHNAAAYFRKSFEDTSLEDWRSLFETNLFAPNRLTKTLLPKLRQSEFASIVNISSTLGVKPVPNTSTYSASKAALNNWTQALALELAPQISVNCICPGIVDTPLHSFTKDDKENLAKSHPLGRVGKPLDIAQAVLFLIESRWITGTLLTVDGGISLM